MKEGPTLVVIPEQRVWNCFSCKYYSYQMIQSGFNPTYESLCLKLNQQGQPITDGDVLNYFTTLNLTIYIASFLFASFSFKQIQYNRYTLLLVKVIPSK